MSAPSWSFRTYFLPVVALAVAAACSDRQAPAGPDDAGLQPGFKGKPGGGDIVVSSVDPPEAEQGVTLEVDVLGRNFPRGVAVECFDPSQECTWAEFGIDEVVDDKVKTNWSRWVSSRKLTAEITIDAEAIPALYDAIVSLRGRRGIGAEKFQVKVRGNAVFVMPVAVTFDDRTGDRVRSDEGGPYEDGDDPSSDVRAQIAGENTAEGGRLDLDRRLGLTGNELVVSERRFFLDPGLDEDLADVLLDPAICPELDPPAPEVPLHCVVAMFFVLDGGIGDSTYMWSTDEPPVPLEDGLLSLSVGQTATTVMNILWFGDTRIDGFGKTVLRYGKDCSSTVGYFATDVDSNRVLVSGGADTDGDGKPNSWTVEGSEAFFCQWGRKRVKGQEPDPELGEFSLPFRFLITQAGPLAPRE